MVSKNRSIRVLVAEDTKIARIALQRMLEEFGCDVVTACDGQEAAAQFDTSFDVVFMDYNMPKMNGDEATKEIRKKEKTTDMKKAVPIIGLTACDSEVIRKACFESGVNKVVQKPMYSENLKELIDGLNLQN